MGRALPLIVLVAVTVFAVVDAVLTPRQQLRSKGWWVAAIILLPVVGPIAWLTMGRRSRRSSDGGSSGPVPPIAPDDDPDFLRGL